ncbi:hypothetical protein [Streptomyces sp. NPDC059850]|uniref:hypothetical protein n=1 Tax=Streptomyces sp. NPDC059850 TaxID=3346970 RepID=UPI0036652B79
MRTDIKGDALETMTTATGVGEIEHAARTAWSAAEADGLGLIALRRAVLEELLESAPCLNDHDEEVRIVVRRHGADFSGHATVRCRNKQCVDPEFYVTRLSLESVSDPSRGYELEGLWFSRLDMGLHPVWRNYPDCNLKPTARFERHPKAGSIGQVWEVSL